MIGRSAESASVLHAIRRSSATGAAPVKINHVIRSGATATRAPSIIDVGVTISPLNKKKSGKHAGFFLVL